MSDELIARLREAHEFALCMQGSHTILDTIHREAADRIESLQAERDALAAQVNVLRDYIFHIQEYWNRDHNESAMIDALYHIIEQCTDALAATPQASLVEHDRPLIDRIERLRGALKTCAGWFYAIDENDKANQCMEWAGDMTEQAGRLAGE